MNVLIACEESQTVCRAFRERGHNAFSCDLVDCSGGHDDWHIKGDALPVVNGDCTFTTADGTRHTIQGRWDLIIAHPPCTYLSVAGNRWFDVDKYGQKALDRVKAREEAVEFFMAFVNADCPHIAVENPVSIMSTRYRKADQIIQPFEYGHPASKQTCLWLKGLPLLKPTKVLEKPETGWENQHFTDGRYTGFVNRDENGKIVAWNNKEIKRLRSKTYEGIAQAMAQQWSSCCDDD